MIIPSVQVEVLGLRHAHVFITDAREECLRCPYAVEAAWVSPDLVQHVLYLHCLVPVSQQRRAAALFAALPSGPVSVLWSGSGWQSCLGPDEEFTLPVQPTHFKVDDQLLRRHPLVVPVLMELWQYPNSMSAVWFRIRARDGPRLRSYVHGPTHVVNGMLHVRDACHTLSGSGLVTGHVLRYYPLLQGCIEVFLTVSNREVLLRLVRELRLWVRAVETYPLAEGFFCRLLGVYQLMDAMMTLAPELRQCLRVLFFHTKRHPSPRVMFAYNDLFDPRTGTWR